MTLEEITLLLKEKNCRITKQRKAILTVLINNQFSLLSADEILKEVTQIDPSVNLTTIYRNLELLEHSQIIYSQQRDRKTQCYKIICMNHHHHHITCTNCGKMLPIDYCPIDTGLLNLTQKEGFTLTNHVMELYGICSQCH